MAKKKEKITIRSSAAEYLIYAAADGKNYLTNHCSFQAIIAAGFKVNNQRAVRFRVWANQIVEQYTIKGWVMDSVIFIKNLQIFMPRL